MFDPDTPPEILHIKVIPKARLEQIKQETRADGMVIYKVYVTAPADKGKANEATIRLLAKRLGVAKSCLSITHGHTSREKIIRVRL